MANNRKAGPITLALGLILIGCALLISNVAGTGIWKTALKFWPVLLIGLGAEYFVRSYISKKNGQENEGTRFHLPTVIIILLAAGLGYSGQQAAGLLKNHELNNLVGEVIAGTAFNYETKFESKPIEVKPGTTKIRIDNPNGKVDLIPSADGNLQVKASIVGWGPSKEEARRRSEMVKINISEGDIIDLSCLPDRYQNVRKPAEIVLRVMVPKGVSIEVNHGLGDIRADNLEANLDIKGGSGDIFLTGIKGSLDVRMESGNLSVKDVSQDVRVSSETGRIEITSSQPVAANYDVTSKFGDIVFRVPETSDITVSAGTERGKIKGSLNLRIENLKPDGPEHQNAEQPGPVTRGTLVLGAGKGTVTLYTENGTITVDKN